MKEPDRQVLLHALGRPELRQNEIRKPPRPSWFRLGLGLGLLGVGFLAALLAVQLFGKTGRPASITTSHQAPFSPLPNPPQFWPQPTPSPGLTLAGSNPAPVQRAAEVLSQPQPTASPALAPLPTPTPTPKTGLVAGPPVALSPTVRVFSPVSAGGPTVNSTTPLSTSVSSSIPAGPTTTPVITTPTPRPTATPTPTPQPTSRPTPQPTPIPTAVPTPRPTLPPTPRPTAIPTPSTGQKGENHA